jgi:hypothetical protein
MEVWIGKLAAVGRPVRHTNWRAQPMAFFCLSVVFRSELPHPSTKRPAGEGRCCQWVPVYGARACSTSPIRCIRRGRGIVSGVVIQFLKSRVERLGTGIVPWLLLLMGVRGRCFHAQLDDAKSKSAAGPSTSVLHLKARRETRLETRHSGLGEDHLACGRRASAQTVGNPINRTASAPTSYGVPGERALSQR